LYELTERIKLSREIFMQAYSNKEYNEPTIVNLCEIFDYVDIVVAPVLIGGKDTSTLIDGISITNVNELGSLGVLQLENCEILNGSYIRLRYKVIS